MNFPMAEGVSIIDEGGSRHAAKNSLFGYMQVDIPIFLSQPTGKYNVIFKMTDQPEKGKPKSCEQTIAVMLS